MTDYPKEIKALYENKCRWQNGARYRRAVPQIGEIIECSVREEDYDKLMGEIERETFR